MMRYFSFRLSLPPLTVWCLFFCAGILVQAHYRFELYALYFFVFVSLFLCLVFLKNQKTAICCIMSAAFFLGTLNIGRVLYVSQCSVVHLVKDGSRPVELRGIILSDPFIGKDKTSFILSVLSLQSLKAEGSVLVRLASDAEYAYGDEIVAQGLLYQLPKFLKNQAPVALSVKAGIDKVVIIGRGNGFWLKKLSFKIKHRAQKIIDSFAAASSRPILAAILLGAQKDLPSYLKEMMVKTGTWHVLVVSGSHTALLAFILLIFFKLLRIPRRLRFCLTAVFLIVYCFMTGATAPVVRATVMAIVFLASFLIQRNPIFCNSMALAGLIILIFDPFQLFQVGFQLSFLSVFFIVWLSPKIGSHFPKAWKEKPVSSFAINCFSVSLGAWLGTAPLLACVFGTFAPVTVFANMVIVPLAMLLTASGFAFAVFAGFWGPLGVLLAPVIDFFVSLFVLVNYLFSKFPGASFSFSPLRVIFVVTLYLSYAFLFNIKPKKAP
jgi:competence protein ComEC